MSYVIWLILYESYWCFWPIIKTGFLISVALVSSVPWRRRFWERYNTMKQIGDSMLKWYKNDNINRSDFIYLKSEILNHNLEMTSLTTLVSTMSVANAAVVFTNWEASSGISMKLSEAMNQYRDCISIADDYQLNPNLCSQPNGLGIVTDMANLLDSYDYSVNIIPGFKTGHFWGQSLKLKSVIWRFF